MLWTLRIFEEKSWCYFLHFLIGTLELIKLCTRKAFGKNIGMQSAFKNTPGP